MKVELEISKITVMITNGTDRISLHTDLPAPYPGWLADEPAVLDLNCTKGLGVAWVQCAFGVDPDEVINAASPPSSFAESVKKDIEEQEDRKMLEAMTHPLGVGDEEDRKPVLPPHQYPLQRQAAKRVLDRIRKGSEQTQGYMDVIRKQGEEK